MAPPSVEYLPEPSELEEQILQKLTDPVEFQFSEDSLLGLVEYLSDRHAVQCVINKAQLEEMAIAVDAQDITLKVAGISLRSVLNLILKPKQLRIVVEDEVLKITTIEHANTCLMTRTYPVRDLVGNVDVDYDLLARAIQNAVGGVPDSPWIETEGEGGTISPLPATGTLVIRQTAKAHDEILKLLRSIRRANEEMHPRTSKVAPARQTPVAGMGVDCTLVSFDVADPRFYPLVGAARLATAQVKCTVQKAGSTDVFYRTESHLIPVN
jgi:hypothetical protein